MSLLLTGFGPFPGVDENPTEKIAKALDKTKFADLGIEALTLPVTLSSAFNKSVDSCHGETKAVVCLGVSTRINAIHIESRAYNRFESQKGDAEGKGKGEWIIEPKGPPHRDTKFSCTSIQARLIDEGIACEVSGDAGRYVCNWLYFKRLAQPQPALFVHVPQVDENWTLDRLITATKLVLVGVAATLPSGQAQ